MSGTSATVGKTFVLDIDVKLGWLIGMVGTIGLADLLHLFGNNPASLFLLLIKTINLSFKRIPDRTDQRLFHIVVRYQEFFIIEIGVDFQSTCSPLISWIYKIFLIAGCTNWNFTYRCCKLKEDVLGGLGRDRAEFLSIMNSRSMFCLWLYIKFERLGRYYNTI